MTLRAPPKPPHATANLVGRFVGLIVLLGFFGVVVWVTATNQQVDLLERSNPLIGAPGDHLSVNGTTLHVREFAGESDPTVLVHDDSMAAGALVVSVAEGLAAEGRRVIVPDLVGFGLSSRPSEPSRIYSTIGQAESLGGLIDELGLAGVEVVGFGWGGGVGADLTIARPDLVTRLVLVDTTDLAPPSTGWHSLEALPFGVGRAVSYAREGASGRAERLFRANCPGPGDCGDLEVIEGFRRSVAVPGTAASIRARRASSSASIAAARLDELEIPVVVISTTDREPAEQLAEAFRTAAVEVVDDEVSLVEAITTG